MLGVSAPLGGEEPPFEKEGIFGAVTLPETNMAPENGWLEDDPFLLGWPIFRGYVSFGEGSECRVKLGFAFGRGIHLALYIPFY